MRRLACLASLLALAAGLGCRPAERESRPLRVAMAPELPSLDPHAQTSHGGYSALGNVFDGLTAFDERMRVVPGLAATWESPDELTWRLHLQRGVLFHDGRALRAEDVVASLERARGAGFSASGALAVVLAISAPAPDVVEIRTARPAPMLLNNLATVFIVPSRPSPPSPTVPIGTGPYRIVAFRAGERLELAAWGRHWRGAPPENALTFLFEADPDRREQMLARGDVEVALRLPERLPQPPGSRYRLLWRAAPGVRLLGMRVDRPPFADARVRHAVDLALDREAIARDLLGGRARPLGQLFTQGIYGHVPELQASARDLVGAQRLLREASHGRPLAVTLDHGPGRLLEAQAIAGQLGEAGLAVTLRVRDVPELLPSLEAGQSDFVLWSYVYATGDAVDVLENTLHSRGQGYGAENHGGYRSAEVDRLIEEGGRSRDMDTRLRLYQDAIRAAMRELPLVPLWEVPWIYGVRDDVDWTPPALGWFTGAQARRR